MLQMWHSGMVFGGLGMKIISLLVKSIASVLFAAMLASAFCPSLWEMPEPIVMAKTLAAGDPVAVISPLPDEVSNGTWWNLNASGSSDSDGMITNYTWYITVAGTTSPLYGQIESFKFRTLGLYKIVLTVRDNDNKTATAFTAVYSIVDSDNDGMPDWWEVKYFKSLRESGSDDHDRDGYTNLQEYASHTDPTSKDPQPGLVQFLKENWLYIAIIAAALIGAILAIMPRMKKKREREEKTKIEFAIEIEKALRDEK
jgi:hypothetical protein